MKEAHGIVVRGLTHRIEGRRRRRDILISYLDKVGKSGAQYAKLYAEENEIYHENAVERGKLSTVLKRKNGIQAVVFVDDFIGTGNSACECFETLDEDCGDILRTSSIITYFIAICGFNSAINSIEKKLSQLNLPVVLHVCDPLDDSARCFSDTSYTFTDPAQREKTKDIASSYGIRLQKRDPLGFGNCQATVVFEDSCPNNSLPIPWDRSSQWMPMFERF